MKKMKYTTKTGCNPLSLRDLGGGIGFAVTSSFTYRYRVFRRCQTMAQAEGSVRFRTPDAHGMVCRLMPMRYGRHYGNEIMQDKRQT